MAPRPSRPCAPSLGGKLPRDANSKAALSECRFEKTGHDAIGDRCATVPHDVSLDRLDEAVPALIEEVGATVKLRWNVGKHMGRNPDAVAFIGDSITASPKFMTPLAHASAVLSPDVLDHVSVDGTSMVQQYRGKAVVAGLDSFGAPRAAKVGAPSGWATPPGISPLATPVGQLIESHNPAIVFLMFGSNDAAVRFIDHDDLVAGFETRMTRIVDQLEKAGIVVVMHTVPRHMHDPARPDCDRNAGDLSNWRMAVQTTAVSEAAARLACKRHLPLLDLRHAFDALLNHGIGPDGVHPNAHPKGAGKLDADGLRCGYNVRNYLTLRMLREIRAWVE